jgi:aminoglycoside phosphotransferase (APT) family kinase protein
MADAARMRRVSAYGVLRTALKPKLSATQRCLIPTDFGLHNIPKSTDGTLGFIDFEYFGWGHPVKLAATRFYSPAMRRTKPRSLG